MHGAGRITWLTRSLFPAVFARSSHASPFPPAPRRCLRRPHSARCVSLPLEQSISYASRLRTEWAWCGAWTPSLAFFLSCSHSFGNLASAEFDYRHWPSIPRIYLFASNTCIDTGRLRMLSKPTSSRDYIANTRGSARGMRRLIWLVAYWRETCSSSADGELGVSWRVILHFVFFFSLWL